MDIGSADKSLISILNHFSLFFYRYHYHGPMILGHKLRDGESVEYIGRGRLNNKYTVNIVVESGKFEVIFGRPISIGSILKFLFYRRKLKIIYGREIFYLSDVFLQIKPSYDSANNVTEINFDHIIELNSKFIEENLLPVIKDGIWIDEIFKNKK